MVRSGEYQHYLDTSYEVWRRGGNADRLLCDRVADHYHRGASPEDAATCEMRRWRGQREARDMQEAEEYAQSQQCYELQDAAYFEQLYQEHLLDAEYGPAVITTSLADAGVTAPPGPAHAEAALNQSSSSPQSPGSHA